MKTLLVTGASSGVGRALAVRAARAGYAVYAVARNAAALDAVRAKIERENGFVATDATDISVAANARPLIARALARFGSIDVLVNNAGFVSAGALSVQSDDELQRQFGTHVIGPIALVREALDALRRSRGAVFMLGSGVARVPVGGLGAYPPAKAAIRSATAILRRELKPDGIGVTYVDPGAIDTAFMSRAGMSGAPAALLVSPEAVARKILIAVTSRPPVLNAVGWQTTIVGFAERFPRLTDALLERLPNLVGGVPRAVADDAPMPGAIGAVEPAVDATSAEHIAAVPAPGHNGPVPSAVDAPSTTNGAEPSASARDAAAPSGAEPAGGTTVAGEPATMTLEAALEPHARRMEKLNLRLTFVRELLVPGATLDLGEIALRWAGMPNKNERAITEDVLEALVGAGFLAHADDHAYRVVRVP